MRTLRFRPGCFCWFLPGDQQDPEASFVGRQVLSSLKGGTGLFPGRAVSKSLACPIDSAQNLA
jgi:hypothetical protein